jgi:hypothetical protein
MFRKSKHDDSIIRGINGLRFEVKRPKNAELRSLTIQHHKENFHKHNIIRLDQTGLCSSAQPLQQETFIKLTDYFLNVI